MRNNTEINNKMNNEMNNEMKGNDNMREEEQKIKEIDEFFNKMSKYKRSLRINEMNEILDIINSNYVISDRFNNNTWPSDFTSKSKLFLVNRFNYNCKCCFEKNYEVEDYIIQEVEYYKEKLLKYM